MYKRVLLKLSGEALSGENGNILNYAFIRKVGEAEAEAIRQKGLAEAEAMEKKAEAYQKYNSAAMGEMLIRVLPEIAGRIAEPLSAIDKVRNAMVVPSGLVVISQTPASI